MTIETRRSFCRFCHAACAIDVDVAVADDGSEEAVAVHGVKDDPVFEGYTCVKGRHLPHQHHHPDRLRTALRRDAAGRHQPIGTDAALDDIAARVAALIESDGPRSIASYCGTAAFQAAGAIPVVKAFHAAIGSPSFYSSITIDQPAKATAPIRHGMWAAGGHTFVSSDVALVIGCNTLVSQYAFPGGIPGYNPFVQLRRARQRGLYLIVVDPRRTEAAEHADLHLQIRPGEDPTLLAGLIRLILDEGRFDHAFCERFVDGMAELQAAVEPFTVEHVAARTGLDAADILTAARRFAAGPRGGVSTGTGPNMAPHPSLTEHLALCLNTLCGRYNREGDTVANPGGVLNPPAPLKAQVIPPKPELLERGAPARVRDLRGIRGEGPTAALADEILEPGEGRVRALFTVGGNPVVAWPDQAKTVAALHALELHVVIEAQLSATARLAHYVIASELSLERPDVPTNVDRWFEEAYANYTPRVLRPSGDVLAEWRVFTEVAARLGVALQLPGGEIAPGQAITADEIIDLVYAGSRVPLDDIRAQGGGRLHPELTQVVEPADAGATGRFQLAPEGVAVELAAVFAERTSAQVVAGFDPDQHRFRLVSRRLRSVFNSSGREIAELHDREVTSYAHLHPDDLDALGVTEGQVIELASPRAAIRAVAKAAPDVRPGAISMAHAWGGIPDETVDVFTQGSTTGALIDNASGYDPITGIPVQSAIPVEVRLVPQPA